MGELSERDVVSAVGPVDRLIVQEILRTEASLLEYKRAFAFAKGPGNASAGAYEALDGRMRRLVDLLTVALEQRPERPSSLPHKSQTKHRAA